MIEIYLKNNTNYENNGDITLEPISCVYNNSESMITLEHQIDDIGRWKYINTDNVLASDITGKKVLYRIFNIVKSFDAITAYARPLFYDLIGKVLLDVRPTNMTVEQALNYILKDTAFTGHSNISVINTAYYIRKNIVESIVGDDENSFLNRWGGEFYCENFNVYINDRIGADNGVRVEFGYNLNAIEEDINLEDVATRIIPVGYDGLTLEGSTPWVDSPNINKYANIKERVITFEDIKVKESEEDEEGFNTIEEARAELIRQCNLLYENGIDKPTVNYKIDMIDLSNTTAYKDFKVLVDVNQGDIVTCYIKELDIDVKARVIDFERDELTGEYNSIELGNEISNFFNEQIDISNKVSSILNNDGSVKAGEVQGFIDSTKAMIRAQKSVAQKQHIRAMLFEDLDESSETYGAVALGTLGFMCSRQRTLDGRDWDFTTAITAEGILAEKIVGSLFASKNGLTKIFMETGKFESQMPDGSKIIISPTEGFYNMFGSSKREYHHLNYTTTITENFTGTDSISGKRRTIQLPDEFKGKKFLASVNISRVRNNGSPTAISDITSSVATYDYINARVEVILYSKSLMLNYYANQYNDYSVVNRDATLNDIITTITVTLSIIA